MSIALNMITGPFDEPFLKASIASCYDLCDEFVFVDTAPGNNPNRAGLEEFRDIENLNGIIDGDDKPVKILELPRGEDKDFSFAAARELARINTDSEWVLRLDADEVFHEKYIEKLKEQVSVATDFNAIKIRLWNHYLNPNLISLMYGRDIYSQYVLMRTASFTWISNIHELPSVANEPYLCPGDIRYNHYGYCKSAQAIKNRWILYNKLGGLVNTSLDVENIDEKNFLETIVDTTKLVDYKEEHPPIIIPKLKELFPGSDFK